MKLIQFDLNDGKIRIGVLQGETVVDISASDHKIPGSLVEFLYQEDPLKKLQDLVKSSKHRHPLNSVKLLSPITKPDKILGLSSNYKGDCDRRNVPYPKELIVFSKFASVITGPYDSIKKPLESNAVDWEVELVVVIGKKAQHVKAANAFDHVFGYTATQDLTAKDWVTKNGGQLLMCKSMNGFCPLGPCVVTKDEFGDPYNIQLRTWVNGELKQDGNSEEMIHKIEDVIEYISSAMTLLPGDIILTGTPYGVGASQIPSQFLHEGDLLETEIEKIGRMANRFV